MVETDIIEPSPWDSRSDERYGSCMNEAWLAAIQNLKTYQERLLGNLKTSIASTYHKYQPDATTPQLEMLLINKAFQISAITQMEFTTKHLRQPLTPEFWPKYLERLQNYDQLKTDLLQTETCCAMAGSGKDSNVAIKEYEIEPNGDTVLEFANSVSEAHALLRFRVSSYMLIKVSPLFARILSSTPSDSNSPLDLLDGFPPPASKQVYPDGAEVKIYRMPQIELNKWEALTTVLHAAHMHNDEVPREVQFQEFVSIAEACLRYQCTSPLEMAVEYRWLPQWLHKANEDCPDDFLLICYVFGLRRLFTRTSKSIVLNITSDLELESKELWPREVKEKISAVREAKLAQIFASCASLMKEYIKVTPVYGAIEKDPDYSLTSVPKCPRGLHQCDAANLGWLMLVYNELGILPIVLDIVNSQYPFIKSNRSISTLVNSLRRMPSAPQLHSGVCDYAPAFRSVIDDIYNSITGLTLRDVSGRDGWALSKRHDMKTKFSNDELREVFEMEATEHQNQQDPKATADKAKTAGDEAISLMILSHLDDLEDLHAAAMINKAFYKAYRTHAVALMKNLLKARKRNQSYMPNPLTNGTKGQIGAEHLSISTTDHHYRLKPSETHTKARPPRRLPMRNSDEDLYGITPPTSPPHLDSEAFDSETPMSAAEVDDILWSNKITNGTGTRSPANQLNGMNHNLDRDSNAKFLSGDIVNVNKSLAIEGKKHLRDEQDRSLRHGLQSVASVPT
jgi:hypothetical protein